MTVANDTNPGGPIAWMAKNHVAANLLMFVVLAGGVIGMFRVKQEVFPEVELDVVSIQVEYPGASPAEVEQAVVLYASHLGPNGARYESLERWPLAR